jgi:uncharacterized protein YdaT
MPYKPSDAKSKTKKADTPARKKQFASTANAVMKKGGDEGKAIRIANAAVAKSKGTQGKKPARRGGGKASGKGPYGRNEDF